MKVPKWTVEVRRFDRPAEAVATQDTAELRLHVECIAARVMVGHQSAWQDLCDRALERNVFFEPSFALPLIQHAISTRRPDFLLVWEENGPTAFSRLIGLLPLLPPAVWTPTIARAFIDPQVRLGTPLLDREQAPRVLDAMLGWIRDTMPGAAALRLCALDVTGPVHAMLAERCAETGRSLRRFGEHRRAVLQRTADGEGKIMPFVDTKRRKEIGRKRRRLSERGVRSYSSVSTPETIAPATEQFLALEHNGWKGQRGTALLARPSFATFTRSMTRMMAQEGKCRIDAIKIDGVPVAMGIILTVGDRAHFWKTTFHEAYRPLSPGVQFALELTDRQLADRSVALTDSCAVADHPMIDRLWLDRMAIADVLIALDLTVPKRFRHACRHEAMTRAIRAQAKHAYGRLRRLLGPLKRVARRII